MVIMKIIISLIILEGILVFSLPEETFLPSPYIPDDNNEDYLYMDTRSDSDPKQSETRRRSTLDRNFARFGRGGDSTGLPIYNHDFSDYPENYIRAFRSGDKSDNFIRFGRGNSDFVRFGRDPYKIRSTRDQHFVRFGRSVEKEKNRSKRDADYLKRVNGNNFVRFGRGNSDFVRFGRVPEMAPPNTSTTASSTQPDYRIGNNNKNKLFLLRFLLDILEHPHENQSRLL